jgi:hypothetical protein
MSSRRRSEAPPLRSPPSLMTPPPSQTSRKSTPSAAKATSQGQKRRHEEDEEEERETAPIVKKTKTTASRSAKKSVAPTEEFDSDGDVQMIDGPQVLADQKPLNAAATSAVPEEEEERKSAAAAESGSDDEYDSAPVDRTGLYQPAQSATPEKVDPSDPFSDVEKRIDHLLYHLSPLHLPSRLPGLESQQKELHDLLSRTMEDSVNNAALVLGPRGSGASALVEVCLRDMRQQFMKQGKSFVEVRLNGAIQTDDTLAMREIVFQVCRDHELEQLKETMDFHAHLNFLVDILNQGTFHDTPIFFILEEFDLFTNRNKQTLLYNLCDLLQSHKAQLCLIGISSYFDCYDRLEKRIRSRMSHRRILIGRQGNVSIDQDGMMTEKAFSLQKEEKEKGEGWREILLERLLLPETELEKPPPQEKKSQEKPKSAANAAANSSRISPAVLAHNAFIRGLLSPKDSPTLHSFLSFHCLNGFSIGSLLRTFSWSITSSLSPRHPFLMEEDVKQAILYQRRDWVREGLKRK